MRYIVDVFSGRDIAYTRMVSTKREARSIAYQHAYAVGNTRPVWCEPSAWPGDVRPDGAGECIGGYDSSRNGGEAGAVVWRATP